MRSTAAASGGGVAVIQNSVAPAAAIAKKYLRRHSHQILRIACIRPLR